MRPSAKSRMSRLFLEATRGRWFRLYAPRSPGAAPGDRLRLAIVSLIPHLGDSVLLFPLLDAIHHEKPDAEISVFTSGMGQILSLHPAIDHLYLVNLRPPRWLRTAAAPVLNLWQQWHRNYRHLRFDVCVVLRGGAEPFRSPYLAWMLGGNIRAGYAPELEPERLEYDTAGSSLFTTFVDTPNGLHEVERGAEVLMRAGILHAPVNTRQPVESLRAIAKSADASAFFSGHPELQAPYAIVAPGASFARRRWNPASFAEIAQTEMLDRQITPVLVGSASERELCESIAAKLNGTALIFAGLPFPELVALCSRATFFVGNDSGPGHVAGALGVPTVEVTAFSRAGDPRHHASPERSRPCGPFVSVLQPKQPIAPCTTECVAEVEHCIAQVEPADVRAAIDSLLAARHALSTR